MVLGYVVIEYNQASKWPGLEDATLFDNPEEATVHMEWARDLNRASGRAETYSIAQVVEIQ